MEALRNKLATHGISIPSIHKSEPLEVDQGNTEGGEDHEEETGLDLTDAETLKRTYTLSIDNTSGLGIQIVSWPVKMSSSSDYFLSSIRGNPSHFHSTPISGFVSVEPTLPLGTTLGPRHLDIRTRSSWLFFDLIKSDGTKVHLQAYIKLSRKGIEEVKLGRTDLDSSSKNSMPSGELGSVIIEGTEIKFVVGKEIENEFNVVDDATKRGIKELPGKGVEVSTYVSNELARASIIVGKEARYHEFTTPTTESPLAPIRTSLHKLESIVDRYIGAFVQHSSLGSIFDGHVKVNAITGTAKGPGFASTADTKAIFKEGVTINYGFHDAGEGRKDQVYVYITPDHQNWIGDLIELYPKFLDLPFSKLALPAAHDSGMIYNETPFTLDVGLAALIRSGKLGNALSNHTEASVESTLVHGLVTLLEEVKLSPERVISNIALTQKDSIPDQLKIGVRFFDYRPGFLFTDVINGKKGDIHHIHAIVPGCSYISFLSSVLTFLNSHPKEFVMVEIKSDGFVVKKDKYSKTNPEQIEVYSMVPSIEDFANCLIKAREESGIDESMVKIAGVEDLDRNIGELISEGKRFIMIDKVHFPNAWPRADSYDHKGYNTDSAAPIIACLEKTFAESSKPEPKIEGIPLRGAIYQLQATPTANIKDDVRASLTYSDSSSLLTYVKPKMDRSTYPWIQSKTFEDPGNVVFIQDMVEGILVEHAIEVSKQRAGVL